MRKTIFLALISVFVVCSCKNESEDYKKAMASNNVEDLSGYIENYRDDAPAGHIDSVQTRLDDLNAQLAFFEVYSATSDVVDKYEVAENYLGKYPDALYSNEMKAYVEKNAELYKEQKEVRRKEQYEQLYGVYVENFVNYRYKYDVIGYEDDWYLFFMKPDYNGEGIGCYSYYEEPHKYGLSIFTYKIGQGGNLEIDYGTKSYLRFKDVKHTTEMALYYDDYVHIKGTDYYYKKGTTAIMSNAKVTIYPSSRSLIYFDSKGEQYLHQEMVYEDEYANLSKMLKDCLPHFKKLVKK